MASARPTILMEDDISDEEFLDEIVGILTTSNSLSQTVIPVQPTLSISDCYFSIRCGNSDKVPNYIKSLLKLVMDHTTLPIQEKRTHLMYCYDQSLFVQDVEGAIKCLEKVNELIILSKDHTKENAEQVLANQKTCIALRDSLKVKQQSDKLFTSFNEKKEDEVISSLCKSTQVLYGKPNPKPKPSVPVFKNMSYVRKL